MRSQTTIRLRRHHLELLQGIAKQLPLYLSRKMDLSRWKYGHAGILIRSLARIQLRDQLVECNASPAVFVRQQPKNPAEVFSCCFQSAKRCEVDLELERLKDMLLDILTLPLEAMIPALTRDAEFCSNDKKTLEQWNLSSPQYRPFGCEPSIEGTCTSH